MQHTWAPLTEAGMPPNDKRMKKHSFTGGVQGIGTQVCRQHCIYFYSKSSRGVNGGCRYLHYPPLFSGFGAEWDSGPGFNHPRLEAYSGIRVELADPALYLPRGRTSLSLKAV